MKPETRAELQERIERATNGQYHLCTYSPGDGVTRYKIVSGDNDYFGGHAVQTVLGISAARDMVSAFLAGWFARS